MNKQKGTITWNGSEIIKLKGGIEWCSTWVYDDRGKRVGVEWGYTSNPVGGCFHACRWKMPTGDIAVCYAETTAEGVAQAQYPQGFEHLYWRPGELKKWGSIPSGRKVFLDSMSDLWGHWVGYEKQQAVMQAVADNPHVQFLGLTKAPLQICKYLSLAPENTFPDNYWAGFSTPPDYFMGKELSSTQKARKLETDMHAMYTLPAHIRWVSVEPLSWDVVPVLAHFPGVLDWIVIGAASNRKTYYQPERAHLEALLELADRWHCPVFYKGNLDYTPWRGDFPGEGKYG